MEHQRVMTGAGVQALALEVLQDFFEDSLAGPLARKIAVLFTQRGARTQEKAEMGNIPQAIYLDTGKGAPITAIDGDYYPDEEPGDGTGAFPDEEYPDEAPVSRPTQTLPREEVLRHLRAEQPGYIRETPGGGEYRLYDGTGTYVGPVKPAELLLLIARDTVATEELDGHPTIYRGKGWR